MASNHRRQRPSLLRASQLLLSTAIGLTGCMGALGDETVESSDGVTLGDFSQALEVHDFDGATMSWAVGYDSAAGRPTGAYCLLPHRQPTSADTAPQQTFATGLVSTKAEFEELIGMRTDRPRLPGQASRFGIVDSLAQNPHGVTLVASTRVVKPTEYIEPAELTASAQQQYDTSYEQFRKRCGDQYLTGITRGGQFIIAFSWDTKNDDEKRAFEATLREKLGAGPWNTLAQLETAVKAIPGGAITRIAATQVGGLPGDGAPPTSIPAVIERAKKLPALLAPEGAAADLEGVFEDYEALGLSPPDKTALDRQREYIGALTAQYDENDVAIDERDYILSHSDQFDRPNLQVLRDEKTALQAQNLALKGLASGCVQNVQRCSDLWVEVALEPLPRRLSGTEQSAVEDAQALGAKLSSARVQAEEHLKILLGHKAKITCGPNAKSLHDAISALVDKIEVLAKQGHTYENKIVFLSKNIPALKPTVVAANRDADWIDSALSKGEDALEYAKLALDDTRVTYKKKRDKVCGVERYKERTDAKVCGTEKVVEKHTVGGGCSVTPPPTRSCGEGKLLDQGSTRVGSCASGKGHVRPKFSHWWTCEVTEASTCRDPDFGVELYKECRHPTFGVEKLECK